MWYGKDEIQGFTLELLYLNVCTSSLSCDCGAKRKQWFHRGNRPPTNDLSGQKDAHSQFCKQSLNESIHLESLIVLCGLPSSQFLSEWFSGWDLPALALCDKTRLHAAIIAAGSPFPPLKKTRCHFLYSVRFNSVILCFCLRALRRGRAYAAFSQEKQDSLEGPLLSWPVQWVLTTSQSAIPVWITHL